MVGGEYLLTNEGQADNEGWAVTIRSIALRGAPGCSGVENGFYDQSFTVTFSRLSRALSRNFSLCNAKKGAIHGLVSGASRCFPAYASPGRRVSADLSKESRGAPNDCQTAESRSHSAVRIE